RGAQGLRRQGLGGGAGPGARDREPPHRAEAGREPEEEAAEEAAPHQGLRALGREDLRKAPELPARGPAVALPGGPRPDAPALAEPHRSPGRRLRPPPRARRPRAPLRLREAPGDAPRRPVLPPPPPSGDRRRGPPRGEARRPRAGKPRAPGRVLPQPHP